MDILPLENQCIQEDCETLLIRFEQLKSIRFTDFAKIWQEMKFSLIYGGRTLAEIDVFVSEILLMVKQYFIKSSNFNLQVGALYLLYGLYYKQPLKNYKKILITLSDWEVIEEFIKEIRENNHFDTLVIINKLISDCAFVWSPVSSVKKIVVPEQYFRFGLFHTNTLIEDMDLANTFKELNDIEEKYVESKNLVTESLTSIEKAAVNYSNNNITQELLNILNSSNLPEATSSQSSVKEKEDIGERRRALKYRCFEEELNKKRCRK